MVSNSNVLSQRRRGSHRLYREVPGEHELCEQSNSKRSEPVDSPGLQISPLAMGSRPYFLKRACRREDSVVVLGCSAVDVVIKVFFFSICGESLRDRRQPRPLRPYRRTFGFFLLLLLFNFFSTWGNLFSLFGH